MIYNLVKVKYTIINLFGGYGVMKTSLGLTVIILLGILFRTSNTFADADDFDYSVEQGVEQEQVIIKFSDIGPNPQREYCIYTWNDYYEKNDIEMKVNSEGKYNEIIVFTCPDCSLEKNYVEPFLNTKVDGKTGADRIRECGFTHAKFQGAKGIQEIERVLLTDVESTNRNVPQAESNRRPIDPVHWYSEGPYGSLAPVDEAEPFESLDSVSETAAQASSEPGYVAPAEEPGYEKPLGVREAEGRPIGE